METKTTTEFLQEEDIFLESHKEKVCLAYINEAYSTLVSKPFNYEESISSEIAECVIRNGEMLMENACVDEDDDEDRCDIINDMGEEFNGIYHHSFLIVHNQGSDDSNKRSWTSELLDKLFPKKDNPDAGVSWTEISIGSYVALHKEVMQFLQGKGKMSFVTHIIFKGQSDESHIYFEDNGKIPHDSLLEHISKLYGMSHSAKGLPGRLDIVLPGSSQDLKVCVLCGREPRQTYQLIPPELKETGWESVQEQEGITFDYISSGSGENGPTEVTAQEPSGDFLGKVECESVEAH